MKLFKYLTGAEVPAGARAAVTCRECGELLSVRRGEHLVCGGRVLHGPLLHVPLAAERVEQAWPLLAKRKLQPLNVVRRALSACLATPEADA